MSSIDERIVQMRFDNKDFESNVGTTMSTLEKLKEKLKFTKSDEGIQNLKNSFNGFNLSGIESGIDSINNRFSALGIAGMEVIRRLTNSAIDMAEKVAKAFTIEPVTDGFEEYELKMNSIQTILMGARTREGLPVTLDMVNEKLNELNTYADKTIYSFSDMTSNIGKFTNAGVSLEDSVAAIQGVSNVAAVSGANAQQASHAMYNFAQALSSGYVKLIDWKSIENANMATVEFKQTLIDTAVELGTLVEEEGNYISTTTDANGNISDAFNATMGFNDALSHQWMTTEVLTATLAKYSDETTELGKKAFQAATQVKTWSQLKDTVKEALGSGWAQTWEYIIGDFEESRDMWTALNNVISGIIDPIANARNEMFKFWHDNGGRDAMLEAFSSLWKLVSDAGSAIKTTIGDNMASYWGEFDGARLVKITESIRNFFQTFTVSDEFKNTAVDLIDNFFTVINNGAVQLQRAGRFVSAFWTAIEPGRKIIYDIAGKLGETVTIISSILSRIMNVFEQNGGLQALAQGLANIFNGILIVIAPVADTIHNFFANLAENEFVIKAGQKLAELAKAFEHLTETINFSAVAEKVSAVLGKLWNVISTIGGAIGGFASGIWDFAKGLFGIGDNAEGSEDKINNLKKTITDLKENAIQWFIDHAPADLVEDVSTAIGKLTDLLQPLKERISVIKESFQDGSWYSKLKEWLGGIVENVNDLRQTISDFVGDAAVQAFTAVWEFIADTFSKFVDVLKTGWGFVKKIWTSLFGDDLYTAANRIFEFLYKLQGLKLFATITDIFDGLSNITSGLDEFATNLKKASINVEKALLAPLKSIASKNKSEALRNVAISVGILTASIIALSFIDFDSIQSGVLAIGELLTMLLAFFVVLNKFTSQKVDLTGSRGGLLGVLLGNNSSSALKSNAVGFVALAASIFILSTSLAKLAGIPFVDLQKGLFSIAELMIGLYIFSKYATDIKMSSAAIAALGLAIDLMSKAVNQLGSLDFESWILGLGGLALIFIELSAFLHDMQNVSAKGFGGIIVLAVGLAAMTVSVRSLAALDLAGLMIGLGGLAILLTELYFFCKKMEDISTKGFAGVIVLAVGLRVLTSSVSALGSLDFETLLKGLGGVAILLIELSAFMHDMNGISGISIAAAAAMIVVAAALKMMCSAVDKLGGMGTGSMIQGLLGIAATMAIFVAACKLLDGVSPMILVASAAMVVMSAAILLITPAIKALGAMPFLDVVQGIGAIAAVFVIFGAAGAILGPLAIGMIAAAGAIAIMAAAITIAIIPISVLGALPLESLGKALLGLAGIFVIFGAAGAILGPLAPLMIAAAGGILALSASAAAAGAALLVVSAGIASLGKAIMIAMDAILALLQSILGGLPFIGDDIDAWFSDRRKALKDNMDPEDAKQTGEDWTKSLGDGVSSAKDSVSGAANDVTDVVKDSLKGVSADAKEAGSDTGSNFIEGLDMDTLKGMMTGDTSAMTEEVTKMLGDSGFDAGELLGDGILDGFTSSDPTSDINDLLTGGSLDMESAMAELGFDTGEAYSNSLSNGVASGAPGLYLTIGDQTKFVTEDTLNRYKEAGLITGQEYTKALAEEAENGSGEVILTMETAMTRLEGINITDPAGVLGDNLANELGLQAPKAEKAARDDLGGGAADGLEDAADYFTDSGEIDAEAFVDAITGKQRDAYNEGKDLGEESAEGMEDTRDSAYMAGQDFGYGFADGTSSTTDYVENAASRLARAALNSMRSTLNEASPSKETRKYGKFGGIGLGLGFKDTTSYVKTQASSLADKGLIAMQSTMERLRDSLNFDTDIDPTIRPVLDLQQIQNGVRTIGNMFGSQQLALAGGFGIDPYAFSAIRNITSAADASPNRNQNVVDAIGELQSEISTLKSAMESMKFEADGKAIGRIAYKEVDRNLGNTFVRNRREGRG